MVDEVATFLQDFVGKRLVSKATLPVLNQLLQSLIEFSVGNYENCEVTFNQDIMSIINFVLQMDIASIADIDMDDGDKLLIMALELKASTVELLEAMLEKIDTRTEKLTREVSDGLDIRALHWSMVDFYRLKDNAHLKHKEYDDNAIRALFKSYSIIRDLEESKVTIKENLSEFIS